MSLFRESSIRKVYDSLHGISGKAIPLSNAVEIMAYCLVDGKVKQESVFEVNLYNELVEQLRKMKARFSLKQSKKVRMEMEFHLEPCKNLPKRTLALIWLYLKIIDTPVQRLLSEKDLWTFDRNDFEKASVFLILRTATKMDKRSVSDQI